VACVELWSVYCERPDRVAVRKILAEDDGLSPGEWQEFRDLAEARQVLARRGLIRVPRNPDDEPTLVEFWL
jgi:hypothetical protein